MNTTKKKSLLSIIIVNWNGYVHLKNCINSLQKIVTPLSVEIIIVDNGSTDNSVKFIKTLQKKDQRFILVENEKNEGYAEGNNIGYKHAKGNFILFLNNDTFVGKNFLKPMINVLQSNVKIGAVQPKIVGHPQTDVIDSIGSYFLTTGFLYHFGHNKKDQSNYNKSSEIFSMKGACMLFKREVLEKVGVFDGAYFAYFEETDLCHRVWLAGYKIMYVPESIIYHVGGQTAKHLESSFVQYHSYKNRIYTYLKNFELGTLISIMPLHILLCELASIMYLITLRFSLAYAIQKAFFWNIFQAPKILQERRKIKKIKRVTDKKYLSSLTRHVRISYYFHLFTTALVGYED